MSRPGDRWLHELKYDGYRTLIAIGGGEGRAYIIAPLTPSAEWPQVKDFAHRFALALAQAEPARFTAALAKAKRSGRIFIDYLRNQRGATAVMPYSARARAFAPVAVPLTWEELRDLHTPSHWHIGDGAEMVKACRLEEPRPLGPGRPDSSGSLKA